MLHPRDYELSPGGIYEPRRRVLRPKQLITGVVAGGVAGGVTPITKTFNCAATCSNGGNSATTGAITTPASSLIVMVVSSYGDTAVPTVSDSKSNSWTQLTSYADGSNSRVTVFYSKNNPTVGAAHTFTANLNGSFPSICVAGFALCDLSAPADVGNGTNTYAATTSQPGSVTPSGNNALVITGVAFGAPATASIDSGFTITDQNNYSGGQAFGGALAWKVQTSAVAVNPTWTFTGASGNSVIEAFKHS